MVLVFHFPRISLCWNHSNSWAIFLLCPLQATVARPPRWPYRSRCPCCRWPRARSWCPASPRVSAQTSWWTWRLFSLGLTWTKTACSPGYRQTWPPPPKSNMVWHQIVKTRLWNSEVFGSSSGTEQRHRESMRLWRDGYLAALTPRNYKQTLTLADGGRLLVFFFFGPWFIQTHDGTSDF